MARTVGVWSNALVGVLKLTGLLTDMGVVKWEESADEEVMVG